MLDAPVHNQVTVRLDNTNNQWITVLPPWDVVLPASDTASLPPFLLYTFLRVCVLELSAVKASVYFYPNLSLDCLPCTMHLWLHKICNCVNKRYAHMFTIDFHLWHKRYAPTASTDIHLWLQKILTSLYQQYASLPVKDLLLWLS